MRKRRLITLLLSSSLVLGLAVTTLVSKDIFSAPGEIAYATEGEGDTSNENEGAEPNVNSEPGEGGNESDLGEENEPGNGNGNEPGNGNGSEPGNDSGSEDESDPDNESGEEITEEGGETEEISEEQTEEQTEEISEEQTEEQTEEIPIPIPVPTYTPPIPTVTQAPSTNRPSDITVVPTEPTTPPISTDETDVDLEEEIDLLKGHYIVYNWNVFTSEEEAQELIDLIEEDEEAQDQLVYELEEISENFFLVRVSYDENADPQGKWVLFYVTTMFNTPEEAQEYMDYNLNIYPDIFFAGEVIEVGDYYNVIYGIRVKADTQAVTYDEETFEIDYLENRQEFTYTVKLDEETEEFVDQIPEAVEEAFPGEFNFTQEQISDTEMEVTMTPVETDEDVVDEDAEIELDIEEETTADDSAE